MKDRTIKQIVLRGGHEWEGEGEMKRVEEGEYG
jgi:hypothetical protein